MGCCCSSCHCNPDIEPSRTPEELSRRNTEQQQKSPGQHLPPAPPPIPALPGQPGTLSGQERPISGTQAHNPTIPDDSPPPYEVPDRSSVFGSRDTLDDVVAASSSSEAAKDLPYVIPLTTTGSSKAEESLAAAYAPDLQSLGVPRSRYLDFLAGLDPGLYASPSAEPGSVSAYIQSMFREGDTLTWSSNTSPLSIDQSQAYVAEANNDIFHKAALHVEVLKTNDMKDRIDAASQAELLRAQGAAKLDKIEDKRSQEAMKLEQRLLTSKTLDKQQKAMRKYLEKDEKYNQKALKAIDKSDSKIDASKRRQSRSDDGVYWLLVTKHVIV